MVSFNHLVKAGFTVSGLFSFLASTVACLPTKVDYVIVGAGPAGLVLAEQLTQKKGVSVVLLEAGISGEGNTNVSTPAIFFRATYQYNWPYLSQPVASLGGARPNLVQGKMVGGGTGINAMLYCRGSASVYDEWAKVSGNKGLAWASMFEAFKATSHWTDEPSITYKQPLNTSSFGNGPLEISRQRELFGIDEPFVNALTDQFDLPTIDFVSGGGIGASQAINSIKASNRTRSFAANTFGYIANGRSNYHLIQNAWVSKINFNGKRAESVTYEDQATGKKQTIRAKEIIVAAGAIKTPQLLMLSGVGPAKALKAQGIKVIADVPEVGQNLIDHHMVVMAFAATSEEETFYKLENNATWAAQQAAAYAADGSGFLGRQDGDAIVASRLPDSVFDGVEATQFKNLAADRAHVAWGYSNQNMIIDNPVALPDDLAVVSGYAAVTQPESRGNIALASANFHDAPLINSQYWSTPAEKAAILYAYRQVREVFNSKAMAQYVTSELYPGTNVTSDEGLWAAIQRTSSSWHHPVGTTSLGTVLGADWRVKGLRGLRVVGSSAAPQIPTCPIQASIYAMAYVAAADIKRDDKL
ncbi:choline dehydrogenase [Xylaria arbuscula]|nr:choline dehydrogenase [Xylaria arbuscula]